MKRYVAACSFGKDSMATVILAKKYKEPLDEVVYCEVMFDEETSGEVPEHRDFVYRIAIPRLKGPVSLFISLEEKRPLWDNSSTGSAARGGAPERCGLGPYAESAMCSGI